MTLADVAWYGILALGCIVGLWVVIVLVLQMFKEER